MKKGGFDQADVYQWSPNIKYYRQDRQLFQIQVASMAWTFDQI